MFFFNKLQQLKFGCFDFKILKNIHNLFILCTIQKLHFINSNKATNPHKKIVLNYKYFKFVLLFPDLWAILKKIKR